MDMLKDFLSIEFNAALKKLQADNLTFSNTKGFQIPLCYCSWRDNWRELTSFYDFPLEIRKIIYTTNLFRKPQW